MYSVLLLNENDKWKFLKNTDGSQYIADSLLDVQEKVKEVAKTIGLEEIVVVKNCIITEDITVKENDTKNSSEQEQGE